MGEKILKTEVLNYMIKQQRRSTPNGSIWYREQGLIYPMQVGVSSAKGGVGKTTLSAWLAYLSAKSGLKTALVEFNWINNPNLASVVYHDIKEKNKIKSFVTKEGINTSFSQSIDCPDNLAYFLISYDDWVSNRTLDDSKETIKAQKEIINDFKKSRYGMVIYDFPNYASKPEGLEPLIETDHRVIVTQRGDASMGTIPKIVHGMMELTKSSYVDKETKKQKLLVINRIEEESSTLKRMLAAPLGELRIDKARREFEKLKEYLPDENFFGENVYFIQEKPEIERATGPGNIMSLRGEGITQFKATTQNLIADIITYALKKQDINVDFQEVRFDDMKEKDKGEK